MGDQGVALYSAGDLVSARRNIEIGCNCRDDGVTAIGVCNKMKLGRPLTLALSPIAGGEGSLFCYGFLGVSFP